MCWADTYLHAARDGKLARAGRVRILVFAKHNPGHNGRLFQLQHNKLQRQLPGLMPLTTCWKLLSGIQRAASFSGVSASTLLHVSTHGCCRDILG